MSFLPGLIVHFFSELHITPLFPVPFFASKMSLGDQLVSMNLASHTQGLLTPLRTSPWQPPPSHPVLFACLGRNSAFFSLLS